MGDWGGRSRTCFWSGSWGSWSLWSNSKHTMVTAAGATRLLYRHQKSMHCIYTQILWLLTLFIACETVSVCFSVTVTEAARFVSVNRAVAFSQSKYCNFTGVILWLVGAFYSPYSNFSTQSPPQIAFNQYTNRKNESRCLYLHSDWVGKTDVWVGLAHPCPCLEPALRPRFPDLQLNHRCHVFSGKSFFFF